MFAESRWRILTLIRLLWRYWLGWFTFRRGPAQTFDKFQGGRRVRGRAEAVGLLFVFIRWRTSWRHGRRDGGGTLAPAGRWRGVVW